MKLNQDNKVIIKKDKYYLKEFYEAEKYIADKLCFFNDIEKSKFPNLEGKIKELEKSRE